MQATLWQQNLKRAYQLLQGKAYTDALRAATAVLKKKPNQPDALMAAGMAQWYLRNVPGAAEFFQRAVAAKPDDLAVVFWYVQAGKAAMPEQTADWLRRQLARGRLDCDQLPLPLQMVIAETLEQAGLYQVVVQWLTPPGREKSGGDPHCAAWRQATLAWNNERLNRLGAARRQALKALSFDKSNFRANVVLARLALHHRQPQHAQDFLDRIERPVASPVNRAIIDNLRGQAKEQEQQYQQAFVLYTRSNAELVGVSGGAPDDIDPYAMCWTEANARLPWEQLLEQNTVCGEQSITPVPVFLVGFPRAGTTLLEKMLDAHPDIASIEEKPTLNTVFVHFYRGLTDESGLFARLRECNGATRQSLRRAYFSTRRQWLRPSDSAPKLIVDKLPLNWMHLGLLAWLFPEARFIVAVRDPRDVALSCYVQLFEPNGAMRHFLDWETTARYLAAVASAGMAAAPFVGKRLFMHRYEDFVADPNRQARALIEFLGLEWHPHLLDFQQNLSGQAINTPSYSRVVQPIDTTRVARWRHFAFAFEVVAPKLLPLARNLGYEVESAFQAGE